MRKRRQKEMKRIVAILLGLFLLTQSTIGFANSDETTLEQIGLGTGSVVGSVIYFPFKTVFCVLGGVGSIYTRIFVGPKSTHELVSTTCRGTWAITPDTLRGKESVRFVGDVPSYGPDVPDVDDSNW
jgi:hypothetical protein